MLLADRSSVEMTALTAPMLGHGTIVSSMYCTGPSPMSPSSSTSISLSALKGKDAKWETVTLKCGSRAASQHLRYLG